jgi:hypothetical protein
MIGFYAGLKRAGRNAFLLGPYDTKGEAESVLEKAHALAERVDPKCYFDTPGVFRLEADRLPAGRLNNVLGVLPAE